ncbi:MAG: lysine--tRNA ligase, partial [Flavobacteriales bacterium]
AIQEVLVFPQMRPEKFERADSPADFEAIGVSVDWAPHVIKAGYDSLEKLWAAKPTAVHQNLNGYRKKNKLEIPAVQLDEVDRWFAAAKKSV